MPSVIVVCTGNICRSPVGEAALRHLLPNEFDVSSAGTHAMVDHPAEPEALEFVSRHIGGGFHHTARQLTRELAESADLVIAMTAEHRAWIARGAPRVVRRTFTAKELDLLLTAMPNGTRAGSVKELALSASRLRPRLVEKDVNLDIADPYGGPPEDYEASFIEVLGTARRIADAITHRLQG